MFTIVTVAPLVLGGCQGDDEDGGDDEAGGSIPTDIDPCGACGFGEYAVDCGYLWGAGEFQNPVCGNNKDHAEFLCESTWAGVVLASPSDNCESPVSPWEPGPHIYADPAGSGYVVVESELLELIEANPQAIYQDATRLDWNEDGAVIISTAGQLSDALGLELGDVLVDVNGYPLDSLLDTAMLYYELRDADLLSLTYRRRGETQAAYYIVR